MNDNSQLLNELKIDRNQAPESGGAGKWWVLAALVLVCLAGAAWWLLSKPKPVEVSSFTVPKASVGTRGASMLDASGYVEARRQATVSSELTGKIVEVLFEEGQKVDSGQLLARMDDSNIRAQFNLAQSQLGAAQGNLREVQVQVDDAKRQLVRTRELASKKLLSQAALDSAQAAYDGAVARLNSVAKSVEVAQSAVKVQQEVLNDTEIRAPFAGVITVKNAQIGEMISALSAGGAGTRTGVGTLVDMASLEIGVDVNENFINRVQAGQPVQATLNAYPDWKIPAKVIAIIPAADRSKATVRVRVGFEETDERILPDMGVRVSFLSEDSTQDNPNEKPRLFIPSDTVYQDGASSVVYLISGSGEDLILQRRAVKVSSGAGTQREVIAGLSGGEKLAIGDEDLLADGLAVVIKK